MFVKKIRTVILPVVGGLLVGGWLFLRWDAHRVKQVQLHLLLERTGLKLESGGESYRIVEHRYQEGWQDFSYSFRIRFENGAATGLIPLKAPWGKWEKQGGRYEFYCTHTECNSDRVFAKYDPQTRELSLKLIHI